MKKKEEQEKKEVIKPPMPERLGVLHKDEFWNWKVSIAEWKRAQAEQKCKELQWKCVEKDTELWKMRFREEIAQAKDEVLRFQKEYEESKKNIEERLGFSLLDCIINEVTLEVSRLNEDNNQ